MEDLTCVFIDSVELRLGRIDGAVYENMLKPSRNDCRSELIGEASPTTR